MNRLQALAVAALVVGCTRHESPLVVGDKAPTQPSVPPSVQPSVQLPGPAATPSPAASPSSSAKPFAASPEEAWLRLLVAMRAYDEKGLERLTTKAGLSSLRTRVTGESESTAFSRWGAGWEKWEVRWKKRTSTTAAASLGPEVKEHGLDFVKDGEGWKLDRWAPGE